MSERLGTVHDTSGQRYSAWFNRAENVAEIVKSPEGHSPPGPPTRFDRVYRALANHRAEAREALAEFINGNGWEIAWSRPVR